MKRISFLLILLFTSMLIFPETLDNFYGVKFGSSKQDALKILNEKGWNISESESQIDNLDGALEFLLLKGGTYAGKTNGELSLYFLHNRFFYCEILNGDDEKSWQKVLDTIIKKYNLISKGKRIFEDRNNSNRVVLIDVRAGYFVLKTGLRFFDGKIFNDYDNLATKMEEELRAKKNLEFEQKQKEEQKKIDDDI